VKVSNVTTKKTPCAQPTLNEETKMSNLTFSSGLDASATQASDPLETSSAETSSVPALRRSLVNSQGELARQAPNVLGYTSQQFVRLAGQQCRMSADEVAYHNRAHEPLKRAG